MIEIGNFVHKTFQKCIFLCFVGIFGFRIRRGIKDPDVKDIVKGKKFIPHFRRVLIIFPDLQLDIPKKKQFQQFCFLFNEPFDGPWRICGH